MRFIKKLRNARQQRGLSFVEFVGCLVAMVGGVVLGSMYLGIDVQRMATGVLEQAQVVAPGYFNKATQPTETSVPDGTVGEIAENETTASTEVPSTEVETEIVGKDTARAALTDGEASPATSAVQAGPEPNTEERRLATRAYWDKLTACMHAEARGRVQEVGNVEEWQLYDYLTQRMKGHEKALQDLEGLQDFAVDERLVAHGEQVVTWHKSGVDLFANAVSLLTDGPNAKLSGPFAQSWQSAATQLRMEENLVVDRHNGLAAYLDREYPEEAPFVPAFQQ